LHRITGGNPFFVTEALATAVDTVPVFGARCRARRGGQLSPRLTRIAELVCVVPGRTENWLLEQAARLNEAGIEGCLGIGMVRLRMLLLPSGTSLAGARCKTRFLSRGYRVCIEGPGRSERATQYPRRAPRISRRRRAQCGAEVLRSRPWPPLQARVGRKS
jgi:hypothetical protein